MTDINSTIEMINKIGDTYHGYTERQVCDDIIEQLRKMSDEQMPKSKGCCKGGIHSGHEYSCHYAFEFKSNK
jgi:hypothetical protein